MAKRAKSIVALSLPKFLNRRYAMLNFNWPEYGFVIEASPISVLEPFFRC